MLNLNQNFDDSRALKVLVVPIGDNSLFDHHFEVISKLRTIPLFEITRPSEWKGHNSPFRFLDWKKGNLLFDYLRYDRVLNGPGDLDNFQCSRRVVMIMGLINYPEMNNEDSTDGCRTKIEEELDYFTRRHPYVVLRRLFVFNFSFLSGTRPLSGPSNDPNALVVFPPDGECGNSEHSMIDMHLFEVMGSAAVAIMCSLENQMCRCQTEMNKINGNLPMSIAAAQKQISNLSSASVASMMNSLALMTPYDDYTDRSSSAVQAPTSMVNNNSQKSAQSVSSGHSSVAAIIGSNSIFTSPSSYTTMDIVSTTPAANSIASGIQKDILNIRNMKKGRSDIGRMRKRMGDLCLQVGSPADSIEHYLAAIHECRTALDMLWLAGALEGFAVSCLIFMRHLPVLSIALQDVLSPDHKVRIAALMEEITPDEPVKPCSPYTSFALKKAAEMIGWAVAEEAVGEALGVYSKNVIYFGLEVECALRFARLHEVASDTHNKNRELKVVGCIMHACSVHGLNAQQQIECILEGSFICRRLGMKRKYAFLLFLAAIMSAENNNSMFALALMKTYCEEDVENGNDTNEQEDISPYNCNWLTTKRILLSKCVEFAMDDFDNDAVVRFGVSQLKLLSEIENQQVDFKLLWSYTESFMAQFNSADGSSIEGIEQEIGIGSMSTTTAGIGSSYTQESVVSESYLANVGPPSVSFSSVGAAVAGSVGSTSGSHNPPPSLHASLQAFAHKSKSVVNDLHWPPALVPNVLGAKPNGQAHDAYVSNASSPAPPASPMKGHVSYSSSSISIQRHIALMNATQVSPVKSNEFKSDLPLPQSITLASAAGSPAPISYALRQEQRDYYTQHVDSLIDEELSITGVIAHLKNKVSPLLSIPYVDVLVSLHMLPYTCVDAENENVNGNGLDDPVDASNPAMLMDKLFRASGTAISHPSQLAALLNEEEEGTDTGPTKGESSLYYDPFAAAKRKQQLKAESTEILWTVARTSFVVTKLSNPLSIPLIIDSLKLICVGEASNVVYSHGSITIPPKTTGFEVKLAVRATSIGYLQIVGVQMAFGNAVYSSRVNEDGYSLEKRSLANMTKKFATVASVVPARLPMSVTLHHLSVDEGSTDSNTIEENAVSNITVIYGSVSNKYLVRICNSDMTHVELENVQLTLHKLFKDGTKQSQNIKPFSLKDTQENLCSDHVHCIPLSPDVMEANNADKFMSIEAMVVRPEKAGTASDQRHIIDIHLQFLYCDTISSVRVDVDTLCVAEPDVAAAPSQKDSSFFKRFSHVYQVDCRTCITMSGVSLRPSIEWSLAASSRKQLDCMLKNVNKNTKRIGTVRPSAILMSSPVSNPCSVIMKLENLTSNEVLVSPCRKKLQELAQPSHTVSQESSSFYVKAQDNMVYVLRVPPHASRSICVEILPGNTDITSTDNALKTEEHQMRQLKKFTTLYTRTIVCQDVFEKIHSSVCSVPHTGDLNGITYLSDGAMAELQPSVDTKLPPNGYVLHPPAAALKYLEVCPFHLTTDVRAKQGSSSSMNMISVGKRDCCSVSLSISSGSSRWKSEDHMLGVKIMVMIIEDNEPNCRMYGSRASDAELVPGVSAGSVLVTGKTKMTIPYADLSCLPSTSYTVPQPLRLIFSKTGSYKVIVFGSEVTHGGQPYSTIWWTNPEPTTVVVT